MEEEKEQKIFEHRRKIFKQKYFILCQLCFWSASLYFSDNFNTVFKKCPVCHKDRIESLPLSDNELFELAANNGREIRGTMDIGLNNNSAS